MGKFLPFSDDIEYYFPKSRRIRGREYLLIGKGYNTKELMRMLSSDDQESIKLALKILQLESTYLYNYFNKRINRKYGSN